MFFRSYRNFTKFAGDPPNRRVMACNDYSFKNIIVFILLQWDVQTIIKLKLKQASKEYQNKFHRKKNTRKASQNVFLFISRFHKVRDDLKRL